MEKISLMNFINQHHQMSLDMIDKMDNNILPQDVLKVLNYLMDKMKAISEQIKTQCLKHCIDEDSELNPKNKRVLKEENDDIAVIQTQGDNSLTADIVLIVDSDDNISTNSTIDYSESASVKSWYKKCKVSVKRIDVNDTRIKPCSVALKRLRMSNILKTHKLELIGVNWPSSKQLLEDKENRDSSMKLKRPKNIKTVKVDQKSARKCISQDYENLSDGCCIQ